MNYQKRLAILLLVLLLSPLLSMAYSVLEIFKDSFLDFLILFTIFFSATFIGFRRVFKDASKRPVVGLSLALAAGLTFGIILSTNFTIAGLFSNFTLPVPYNFNPLSDIKKNLLIIAIASAVGLAILFLVFRGNIKDAMTPGKILLFILLVAFLVIIWPIAYKTVQSISISGIQSAAKYTPIAPPEKRTAYSYAKPQFTFQIKEHVTKLILFLLLAAMIFFGAKNLNPVIRIIIILILYISMFSVIGVFREAWLEAFDISHEATKEAVSRQIEEHDGNKRAEIEELIKNLNKEREPERNPKG